MSPLARTRSSSLLVGCASISRIELRHRLHVFVPAPAQADQDPAILTKLARELPGVVERVRRLKRGHDALDPRTELERRHRLRITDCHVLGSLQIAQQGVLRAHAGVVQPRRDRVRGQDLAVGVLDDVRKRAMKYAWPPSHQGGGVAPALDTIAAGLDSYKPDVAVANERGEDADCVR